MSVSTAVCHEVVTCVFVSTAVCHEVVTWVSVSTAVCRGVVTTREDWPVPTMRVQ